MKSLVAPDVPANDGCYRPIAVHIPPGHDPEPAAGAPVVGGNHETSQRVVDACYKALAQAIPERITAGGPTTAGLLIFGTRQDGRWRILYEVHGGGEGAGAARDGGHAMRVHMSNVMNTPIEVVETEYPIEILRPGAPAGERRGGRPPRRLRLHAGLPGARRGHADDHARAPGRPALGRVRRRGRRARTASRSSATGRARDVKGKETLRLRPGDVVADRDLRGRRLRRAGTPGRRSSLARDRLEGYVRGEGAR